MCGCVAGIFAAPSFCNQVVFAIHRVLDRVSCVLEGSFVLGTNLAEGVMNLLLRWLIYFKNAD